MAIFSTAVQCPPVDNQANVNRLRSVISDKHIVLAEGSMLLPKNNFIIKARYKIVVSLVTRYVVQLCIEHMTVVEDNQAPAVSSFKTACAIAPGHTLHPVEKISFKHSGVPGIRRCYKDHQRCY